MKNKKPEKKRVVVTTSKKKVTPTATQSKNRAASSTNEPVELLYGKDFYGWVMLGIGLIAAGLFCMLGGAMPSPDVWDDNIIYHWRITVLAPILILAGLGVEIYAIFKK